jgi:hypothetical protein
LPYVICSQCQLRSYTAATHSVTDGCPRCGTEIGARQLIGRRPTVLARGTRRPSLFIRWAPDEQEQAQA